MATDQMADALTGMAHSPSPGGRELEGGGAPPSRPSPIEGEGVLDSASAAQEAIFQRYALYLRGQRGLSENTVRIYLSDLDSFRRYLVRERLTIMDMDRRVLRGYLAWLATDAREGKHAKEGYARVSITRKLTALRSFYRFLVQEGLFRTTPVPSGRTFQVKVEKHLPSFLGHQEVQRLLETPDESSVAGLRDRAILEVLYSCGVRLAEIQGIDLQHLDLERRQILVRGKGSKERWVLFGKPTEQALLRYLQEGRPQLQGSGKSPRTALKSARGEPVEPSADFNAASFDKLRTSGYTQALFLNRYGQRLSRRSIEKLVRRYAARAGLRDGVHPHTLRHTFASHMLEGNADLRVIQELLGHSSPTTTQIYTHVTKQEARAAYLTFHPRAAATSEE